MKTKPLRLKNFIPVGFKGDSSRDEIYIDESGLISDCKYTDDKCKTVDLKDSFLSPGWIDMHAHIYYGATNLGIRPKNAGIKKGVCTVVDAGSSGYINFTGFKEYIVNANPFNVFCFLNAGAIGLVYANDVSDLIMFTAKDIDETVNCINENKDIIKGVKIRASGEIFQGRDISYFEVAKQIAVESELPLMVHIGEPTPMVHNIIPLLDAGDIITHAYHGKRWGIKNDKKIRELFKNGYDRGIIFDVGHGNASFNFNTGKIAFEAGMIPHTVSTDLHNQSIDNVESLSLTMSKMLAMGLPFEHVIKCVTQNPAKILNLHKYSYVESGKKAMFTAFTVSDTDVEVSDADGNVITLKKQIKPIKTILGGNVISCI